MTAVRFAVRGRLLLGDALREGSVLIRDGRIEAIVHDALPSDVAVTDADLVAPGLIDLQVNGALGHEVGDDASALRSLAAALPSTGVTSYLPTLISSTPAFYRAAHAAFLSARGAPGARALGLHLEGPLLARVRAGAHPREVIDAADFAHIAPLLDDVTLATVAPERGGALDCIAGLVARGVRVGLGHTDATYAQFIAGVDRGAVMATHLFNAMRPFTHREPGAVGAALDDDRVTIGLIVDGVHSHRAAVKLALRAKGVERVALVTDAMAAAGMTAGTYALSGQQVTVDATSARLADGTLAGSVLTMDRAVRNAIALAGVRTEDALRMAGEVPARVLGRTDIGRIAVGAAADLVLFDRALTVQTTLVDGVVRYRAG